MTDQIRKTISVWNYNTGEFLREWAVASYNGFAASSGIAIEPRGNRSLVFRRGDLPAHDYGNVPSTV